MLSRFIKRRATCVVPFSFEVLVFPSWKWDQAAAMEHATLASLTSSSVILGRGTRDEDLGGGLSSAAGRPQSPLSMWTLSLG